ncbi:peptide ABC transporter substrate-binding protein [Brevibacillus daliensis]|uniref:peptide ABC transporter substrate-binding protein n=1 Tax=Brevibacillus daliensis TaxID=2892995 RepID=UPI001E2DAFF1|nr:peptide ABC transporter substrate-binding protein [Brevibacillus daliensis]
MKKASTIVGSAVLSLALLLAGCSSGGAPTAEPGKDTPPPTVEAKMFNVNNGVEPTSLDPPIGFDQVSYDILNNIMEGMTRLSNDQQPEAAMAEKWEISDDKLTYKFTLRDAKWTNGDPVKASDFEYAWKRLIDPATASPAGQLAVAIEGAEDFLNGKGSKDKVAIKALDEKTLEVKLRAPAPYFLLMISNPAYFPVHQATVEKDANWAKEATTFVGNGPFKISEWKHDNQLTVVKNEDYWDAANIKLAGATFKMVDDANTMYQLYQTGELDLIGMPPADMLDQLFAENKLKVSDGAGTYFYRFNVTKEPFNNKKIRQAFGLAIDRQKIVDFVNKRKEKPATGYVNPGFKDPSGKDFREASGELVKFDAAKAKELLAEGMKEAGYTTLPEVTLSYSTSTSHQKIAQALQEMLKENLGVEVKLEVMDSKVFGAKQKGLELQLSRSSFLPDFGDPINYLDGFLSNNTFNRTGWKNADYDKLIQDIYKETDETKRYDLMYQAEKLLMDEAPFTPLYFYNNIFMTQDNIEGYSVRPLGYLELKGVNKK